jgi:hypothetical protein
VLTEDTYSAATGHEQSPLHGRDGDFVIGPCHDECGAADRGKTDSGIGTVHDRELLADECLRTGFVCHLADYMLQREVGAPCGAYPALVEEVDHLAELAVRPYLPGYDVLQV